MLSLVSHPCCPLCGGEGGFLYRALLDWASGVQGNWGIRGCSDCGTAWLDPQPVPEDIGKLYPSRYYTHEVMPRTRFDNLREAISQHVLVRMGYPVQRSKALLPRLLSRTRASARAATLGVMDLPPLEGGTLLDVGCGNGHFLLRMRSLGWRVAGVDPDPASIALCQSHGLQAFHGSVSAIPNTDFYDAITLGHVIEHAPDPIELLRECKKRLRPGTGRLVITTPNIHSFGHWWFGKYWFALEVPRHLNIFSRGSLSQCVERAELRVISSSTETRMAHMIYNPSVCARKGERSVMERRDFPVPTKAASYLFQFLEDVLVRVKGDAGEEIFCVCGTAVNS